MFTSRGLSLGKDICLLLLSGYLKCWIVLAKALNGKETSGGQGGFVAKDELEVATTSTICQGNLITGKLSLSFLNYAWGCLSY